MKRRTQSGGCSQPRRHAPGGQRLHLPLGLPDVSNRARRYSHRLARRDSSSRATARRLGCHSFSRSIPELRRMPSPAQIARCAGSQQAHAAQSSATTQSRTSPSHTGDRQSRRHPHLEGGEVPLSNGERRASAARRSSRFSAQSLGSGAFTAAIPKSKTPAETGVLMPIAAEPRPSLRLWASAQGATPGGLIHPNLHLLPWSSKPDISTWQRIGHFYLALTEKKRKSVRDSISQLGNLNRIALLSPHDYGQIALRIRGRQQDVDQIQTGEGWCGPVIRDR